jgi:transcriptional regulator with PAS, ATPase and Fis domain
VQLKLLRVIQEKELERVGDSQSIKVDVRIIASTNQPLKQKVERGEFREDLYYRLKVVEIILPPLRERREDIELLVIHFCGLFNTKFGKGIEGVNDDVLHAFMQYEWPETSGNLNMQSNMPLSCVTVKESPLTIYPLRSGSLTAQKGVSHSVTIKALTAQTTIRAYWMH